MEDDQLKAELEQYATSVDQELKQYAESIENADKPSDPPPSVMQYVIDVGRGFTNGISNAIEETVQLSGEVADWADKHLPTAYIDFNQSSSIPTLGGVVNVPFRITTQRPEGNVNFTNVDIPDLGPTQTTPGNVTEGITQFLAGFVGAGKIKGLAGAKGLAGWGQAAARGAVTDAVVFDPHQARLSNLIEQYPELQNPITNYLMADANDSSAEGRFKNALEGLAAGTVVDGLFKSLRFLKSVTDVGNKIDDFSLWSNDRQAMIGDIESEIDTLNKAKGVNVDDLTPEQNAALNDLIDAEKEDFEILVSKLKGAKIDDVEQLKRQAEYHRKVSENHPEEAVREQSKMYADYLDGLYRQSQQPESNVAKALKQTTDVAVRTASEQPQGKESKVEIPPQKAESFIKEYVIDGKSADNPKADFNYDKIETSEDVKTLLSEVSTKFDEQIATRTRGRISQDETKRLANQLGMSVDEVHGLSADTERLDSRLLAARQVMTNSAERIAEFAKAARGGDVEAYVNLNRQIIIHAQIQAEVKGVQTEVARALQAMKIHVGQGSGVNVADIGEVLGQIGKRTGIDEEAVRALATIADDAAARGEDVAAALQGPIRRMINRGTKGVNELFSIGVAGLVSHPATHAVNIISNAAAMIGQVGERAIAGSIGGAKRAVGQEGEVYSGEALQMLFGVGSGIRKAFRASSISRNGTVVDTFKSGQNRIESVLDPKGNVNRLVGEDIVERPPKTIDTAGDWDTLPSKTFDSQWYKEFSARYGTVGKGLVYLSEALKLPFRVLSTEDEFFKTLWAEMELRAQAYRIAKRDQIEPDKIGQFITDFVNRDYDQLPTEVTETMLNQLRYGTFTQQLGKGGQAIQSFRSAVPVTKIALPFVRTPANILKYNFERMPGINLAMKEFRADFAAGGARQEMFLARSAAGGLMMYGAYELAASGAITGRIEREDYYGQAGGGIQQYSYKVGDSYISYQKIEPVSTFLGIMADTAQLMNLIDDDQERERLYSGVVAAVGNNITSKSFLTGLSNLFDALYSNDRTMIDKSFNYLNKTLVAYTVPNSVNYIRQSTDDRLREARTLIDMYYNKLPGYSKDLPPNRDYFGNERRLSEGFLVGQASPMKMTTETKDAAYAEVARLRLNVTKPGRTLNGIELTADEYDQLIQLTGQPAHEAVKQLIKLPTYKNMPDGDEETPGTKAFALAAVIARYKTFGKQKFIATNDSFKKKIVGKRQMEIDRQRAVRVQ